MSQRRPTLEKRKTSKSSANEVRLNPLVAQPPIIRGRQLHRMGELVLHEIQNYFKDVDSAVKDVYKGVHLTPHPVVAAAYAMDRRVIEENDYGYLDIVDPPVLIGLHIKGEEYLDADGYIAAMNIYNVANDFVEDDIDLDNPDEFYLIEFNLTDYAWEDLFLDPYLGLNYVGGEIGNRPELNAFLEAVREQMSLVGKVNDDALLKNALRLAQEIVPQSRVCRDIVSDEVVALVVLAPYTVAEKDLDFEETPTPPFYDFESFFNKETPEEFNKVILEEGTVIYGDPANANRWHGTSLSVAETAFPDLLTSVLVEKALKAGSPYDLETFEEEFEEEEEDDENYD